jgi:hypothetical protein
MHGFAIEMFPTKSRASASKWVQPTSFFAVAQFLSTHILSVFKIPQLPAIQLGYFIFCF